MTVHSIIEAKPHVTRLKEDLEHLRQKYWDEYVKAENEYQNFMIANELEYSSTIDKHPDYERFKHIAGFLHCDTCKQSDKLTLLREKFGWLGSVSALAGASLLAFKSDFAAFSWLFFLASCVFWMVYARQAKSKSLMTQQVGFMVINLVGMYFWLIKMIV